VWPVILVQESRATLALLGCKAIPEPWVILEPESRAIRALAHKVIPALLGPLETPVYRVTQEPLVQPATRERRAVKVIPA